MTQQEVLLQKMREINEGRTGAPVAPNQGAVERAKEIIKRPGPRPSTQEDAIQAMNDDYSGVAKAIIGFGRGLTRTGQGAKQIGLNIGESLGFVSPDEVESYRQKISRESRNYEAGIGSTWQGNLGEFAGEVVATAPTLAIPGGASASVARRIASAGLGGAAVGASQPVFNDGDFWTQKTLQTGLGLGGGAGVSGTLAVAGKTLRAIAPESAYNLFMRSADEGGVINKLPAIGGESQAYIREGEVLSKLIPLTPAQVTGSRALSLLENAARQSIWTADRVADFDLKVARKGMQGIARLARTISRSNKDSATIGAEIRDATATAARNLIDQRRKVANIDYGLAEQIAGGRPVVSLSKYKEELNSIMDEFSGIDADDYLAVTRKVTQLLDKVTDPKAPSLMTVQKAVQTRSGFGSMAQGSGNLIKDADKGLNKRIAGRLHRALTLDLLDAETLGDEALAAALRKANTNYANNSSAIDAVFKSPLASMLGEEIIDKSGKLGIPSFNTKSGERVGRRLLGLPASELRTALGIVDNVNPNLRKDLLSFTLKDTLRNSMDFQIGSTVPVISFNKFATNLSKVGNDKLRAMGIGQKHMNQLNQFVKAMRRAGDRTGYNFSGTASQASIFEWLKGGATKTASTLYGMLGLNRIADFMTSKEGTQTLLEISRARTERGFTRQVEKLMRLPSQVGALNIAERSGQ